MLGVAAALGGGAGRDLSLVLLDVIQIRDGTLTHSVVR